MSTVPLVLTFKHLTPLQTQLTSIFNSSLLMINEEAAKPNDTKDIHKHNYYHKFIKKKNQNQNSVHVMLKSGLPVLRHIDWFTHQA